MTKAFVVVAIMVFVLIVAMSGYAGFNRWSWWTILVLSALLAVNKVNYKSMSNDTETFGTTFSKHIVGALVNWPFMLVFTGLAYGLGYFFSTLFE